MTVKGVIMAGGLGTRFKPLTYYIQKCMIPVGDSEAPILEYIVKLFKKHEIKELVLLVGYKHRQIVNYFGNGSRFGVKMRYVEDDPGVKGSANAILHAYDVGALSPDDTLLVYYGDILCNLNLRALLDLHIKSQSLSTVVFSSEYQLPVGVGVMEDTRLTSFLEKPRQKIKACIGILAIDGKIINHMRELHQESGKKSFDLMGDVIQSLVSIGEKVSGYVTDEFWYDVGSIERYESLSNEVIEKELKPLLKI